ncbi:MAG: hypothetical protein F6J89_04780 [Symploca sp. SIO1C4]|uniref:Uncharacterized protein n=1 Tax=Symploca sp. SIO1C4 TaxID=2607765 RepID=A0A6B3N5U5_9CYAN|nr:hypothetical protein [Symploca sp. SIO1C4]
MNNRLRQFLLENVVLAILVGLLTNAIGAWIVEFFNDQASVKQYKAISMLIFILFTPIASKYLFKKFNLGLNKIASLNLVLVFMLVEATLFSVLPTKRVNLNQYIDIYPREISELLEGEYIKKSNFNEAWIRDAKVGGVIKTSSLRPNELHLLFNDIEWNKYEKWRVIKRNYRGYIQYEIIYNTNCRGTLEIESKIIDYSFRPGKDILSFVIGFIETAYLVQPEREEFVREIDKLLIDKQIFEQIKLISLSARNNLVSSENFTQWGIYLKHLSKRELLC